MLFDDKHLLGVHNVTDALGIGATTMIPQPLRMAPQVGRLLAEDDPHGGGGGYGPMEPLDFGAQAHGLSSDEAENGLQTSALPTDSRWIAVSVLGALVTRSRAI